MASVLIVGESGTGKELVAKAIHEASVLRPGAFIATNCGAVPVSLFESEFFGSDRGAFTDARTARAGLFERAAGGTLFLDEVAELPFEAQAKLLRALEEGSVNRLGSTRATRVDVRLLSATNVNLQTAITQRTFRPDLFWRINTLTLRLAPLRERAEDIPLLADHFLATLPSLLGVPHKTITTMALRVLTRRAWPGNVRELRSVLATALILGRGDSIMPADVDIPTEENSAPRTPCHLPEGAATLADARKEAERRRILQALTETAGRLSEAAALLGIDRRTLYSKIRIHGLGGGSTDDRAATGRPGGT